MDQNIAKLANSLNIAERKQSLKSFLADETWPSNKSLANLYLSDPDKTIVKEISDAILTKCPERYLPELKLLAVSEDNDVRATVLSYLSALETFKGLELLLERVPLEDPALAIKLKQAVKKMLERDTNTFLAPLLVCTGSDNDSVRKEALSLLVSLNEPLTIIREFYLYIQGISPTVREKILSSTNKVGEWFINTTKELLAQEQDPNVRLQALNLLLNLNYADIEAVLIEEMKQKDWALKHYVIKALSTLKSENAKPLFIQAMEDKEISIQAILALDAYRQQDIGIVFLRKLGKSSDDEQQALLNCIKNIADKRYLEPLLVFAAHEVCKLPNKILVLKVVEEICEKTSTEKPAKALEIEEMVKKMQTANIPDLGLKLSLE